MVRNLEAFRDRAYRIVSERRGPTLNEPCGTLKAADQLITAVAAFTASVFENANRYLYLET